MSESILLCRPSLRNSQRNVPPLLSQRNENPKPRNHLHKRPRKYNSVLQSLTPGTGLVCLLRIDGGAVAEGVRVDAQSTEEEKPYGRWGFVSIVTKRVEGGEERYLVNPSGIVRFLREGNRRPGL
jgi:hypothetical protein